MNDNWRLGRMVLWIWTWFAIWARLRLHLFRLCQLRPAVALGSRQVTDLLSWTHTCVWAREGSLLSCHGFRLFPDWLIGGGGGGGLSTILSPGLRCGGLESKFRRGPRPLDRRVVGSSCLCLGYKWAICFWGTQLGALIRESPTF